VAKINITLIKINGYSFRAKRTNTFFADGQRSFPSLSGWPVRMARKTTIVLMNVRCVASLIAGLQRRPPLTSVLMLAR